MSERRNYRCRKCGMVRESAVDVVPWCRHGDVALPAARMVPVAPHWPLFADRSSDPGMEWLAGR